MADPTEQHQPSSRSVRARLTLWYTLMLASTVVVLGIALYALLVRTLSGEADSDVSTTTFSVARAIGTRTDPATGEVQLQLPELNVLGDADTYVQVVDLRSSTVLARSANLVVPNLPPPPAPFPSSSQSGGEYDTYETARARFRIYSRPILVNGAAIGMVQAAHSLTADDRLFERLRWILGIVAGLGLPVAAGVGWWLAARALAPVEVAHSELAAAYAELADANHRLERSLTVQRQFVADASHELRTPLTTIRANIDVLRWTTPRQDADQLSALADLAGEAERMSRLVESLLTLARADSGPSAVLVPIQIGPVVKETFRHAQVLAHGQRLELVCNDDIEVIGNSDALHQLLLILLDNAIKYTPPQGHIIVHLARDRDAAYLMVSDNGIGMSVADAQHVFEPFFRADAARETTGSGLGLAIARRIAHSHRGRIEVHSNVGLGSTFTVVLPALPARDLRLSQPGSVDHLSAANAVAHVQHAIAVDDNIRVLE